MYLNWMSTASLERGQKCVSAVLFANKIDTASVYKVLCFPAWSNQPF